jgi:PleD family two-component response regulator
MLTILKGDRNADEAYAAGVTDFVTKPFDRGDLKARIDKALAN